MQEVRTKTALGTAEIIQLFFCTVFLVGSALILYEFDDIKANNPFHACNDNYYLIFKLIFYVCLFWLVYLLISIVPKCQNESTRVIFRVMNGIFILALFIIFIYANVVFFQPKISQPPTNATTHYLNRVYNQYNNSVKENAYKDCFSPKPVAGQPLCNAGTTGISQKEDLSFCTDADSDILNYFLHLFLIIGWICLVIIILAVLQQLLTLRNKDQQVIQQQYYKQVKRLV